MIDIREMTMADYDVVFALLRSTPGIVLRPSDSREATARYLARNPGLSFVARCDSGIAGCVMCGHDGRRGYLQHLTVAPAYRRRGIATALVECCLAALRRLGIDKAHCDVLAANTSAQQYWAGRGWLQRDDIVRYSRLLLVLLYLVSAFARDRVGQIEFFRYKGVDLGAVRQTLPVHAGDAFTDATKAAIRRAVTQAIGRQPADVEAICRDENGDRLLYIG